MNRKELALERILPLLITTISGPKSIFARELSNPAPPGDVKLM